MTLLALVPLFSVVLMLLWRGGQQAEPGVFTQLPPAPLEQGGGFGNAIVGTLIIVGLAVLISVPIGMLTRDLPGRRPSRQPRSAQIVRFCAKVLTGFPSILAGVFAYGAVVLTTGGYSAIAGAVALSILMLPTIMLTAEDAIRMVPARMKEAAIGMGATQHADRVDGAAADGDARHPDRRHAGRRARGRRNRAAAVHRAVQQLLALVARPRRPDAADRVAGRADLQLCRHAVSEPGGAGLGRRAGAGAARARRQSDRPEPVRQPDPAD